MAQTMKQTAVDWLVSELPTIDWTDPYWQAKLKEAKEMEKRQACGFACDFIDDKCYASFEGCVRYSGSVEGYYDETFNANRK
jgi:hypothetical protein